LGCNACAKSDNDSSGKDGESQCGSFLDLPDFTDVSLGLPMDTARHFIEHVGLLVAFAVWFTRCGVNFANSPNMTFPGSRFLEPVSRIWLTPLVSGPIRDGLSKVR
jgi:hypothetical protein